ncbi:integrase [Burkholderia lata]|uniref:hypothetical protein n=1 Tax=Burkholderia lata (strain ATCC 17760 / DSM 23089 / LMG 22485 / NCIMB 9086 / R18194 / 383) TaxID=482957 RepID=UPI001454B4DA|nr:hypothetical protein [Burkholderia lata]VWC05616.1 integrase [Burkholderia lata]
MADTERIAMTMRERDTFKVIRDVPDCNAKPRRVDERPGLTTRRAARLIIGMRRPAP